MSRQECNGKRPIPGVPRYFATDDGDIISMARGKPRVMTGTVDKDGYAKVSIWVDGRPLIRRRASLVCAAYHGPRPPGAVVTNINGDRSDDSPSNLTWKTARLERDEMLSRGLDPILPATASIPENRRDMGDPRLPPSFWEKVTDTGGCWEWGGCLRRGYGYAVVDGREIPAHRVLYSALVEPAAEGQHVDHLCRNRACVNPEHLEMVDPRTNCLRGGGVTARNARKTHCKRGHELAGKNLYIRKNGHRQCKACRRLADARQRAKG